MARALKVLAAALAAVCASALDSPCPTGFPDEDNYACVTIVSPTEAWPVSRGTVSCQRVSQNTSRCISMYISAAALQHYLVVVGYRPDGKLGGGFRVLSITLRRRSGPLGLCR